MAEAAENPQTFRWSRAVTMAAVLLIHVGFVILLLLPGATWQWRGTMQSAARSDALSLHFIDTPPVVPTSPRNLAASHARTALPIRQARISAPSTAPKTALSIAASASVPLPQVDNILGTLPSYIAGGGRFAGEPGYSHDNVHLPGGAQPVHGMPVFHMADPKMQGIAGAARTLQKLFGVVNRHCVDVDVWRNMTRDERLAHHITNDQIDETAEQNGCIPPESGADRYHH